MDQIEFEIGERIIDIEGDIGTIVDQTSFTITVLYDCLDGRSVKVLFGKTSFGEFAKSFETLFQKLVRETLEVKNGGQ